MTKSLSNIIFYNKNKYEIKDNSISKLTNIKNVLSLLLCKYYLLLNLFKRLILNRIFKN